MKKIWFFLILAYSAQSLEAQSGQLDPNFAQNGRLLIRFNGTGTSHDPTCLTIQKDGKIIVAGFGFHLPGVSNVHICVSRILSGGRLDSTFSQDGKGAYVIPGSTAPNTPRAVHVYDDGKILLFFTAGNDLYFLKLLQNGDPDTSFSTTAGILKITRPLSTETALFSNFSMLVPSDGKIVVFYKCLYSNLATTIHVLLKFNADGTPDKAFNSSGRLVVDSSNVLNGNPESFKNVFIGIQTGNKIILAGDTITQNSPSILYVKLMRVNPDGSYDQTFGNKGKISFPKLDIFTNGIQIDAKQNILIAGMIGGTNAMAKFLPNGIQDLSYGTNGVASGGTDFIIVNSGLVLSKGQSILGCISSMSPNFQTHCKSFNDEGFINNSFGNNGIASIPLIGNENILRAIEVQEDGKILLACKHKDNSSINVVDFELIRILGANPSAIDELSENGLKVYPNPVQNVLNVEVSNLESGMIMSIIQSNGQVVKNQEIHTKLLNIDLKDLSSGVYFIRLSIPNKKPFNVKFVKI